MSDTQARRVRGSHVRHVDDEAVEYVAELSVGALVVQRARAQREQVAERLRLPPVDAHRVLALLVVACLHAGRVAAAHHVCRIAVSAHHIGGADALAQVGAVYGLEEETPVSIGARQVVDFGLDVSVESSWTRRRRRRQIESIEQRLVGARQLEAV